MRQQKVLTLFIGSPSDLQDERKVSKEVIDRLNNHLARNLGLHLELRGWQDTLSGVSRPQEKINADIRKCDLFVGLLWKRWGMPSGKYSSGFEEEFELAFALKQEAKIEDIWLFFKQIPQEFLQDPGEQLAKVQEFKRKIEAKREILYKEFDSLENWGKLLYDDLTDYITRNFVTPLEIPIVSPSVFRPIYATEPSIMTIVSPNRKEITETISNVINSIPDDEKLQGLDNYIRARLHLLSSALLYDSALPMELLGTHEIQFLYTYREKVELLPFERKHIIRTLAADEHEVKAGWYWFRDFTLQSQSYLQYLSYADQSERARIQALKYLRHISQSPDLETIKISLNDSSENIKIAALQIFEQHGKIDAIPYLETLLNDGSSEVIKAAWTAIFAIYLKLDTNKAFTFLIATPKSKRGQFIKNFDGFLTTLTKENVEQLLQDEDEFVQLKAFKHLKATLSETQLHSFTGNQMPAIRVCAYLELIKRNVKLNTDEIKKTLENISPLESIGAILAMGGSTTDDPKNAVLLEAFKQESFEELEKSISWFSIEGPLIYGALADHYFSSFKKTLRQDILQDFERIKIQAIDLLKTINIQEADKIISSFEKFDSSIKTDFLSSAIRALSLHAEPSDIEIARFLITKTTKFSQYNSFLFQAKVLSNILTIFEKYGTVDDAKLLLQLYIESQNDLKIRIAELLLKLDNSNQYAVVEFLIDRNDTELTKVVLRNSLKNGKTIETVQLKELLLHSDIQMRLNALSYLAFKLTEHELKVVLDEYLQSETYYYNVVCWLDRWLYAPKDLQEWYRGQMASRLL